LHGGYLAVFIFFSTFFVLAFELFIYLCSVN